MRLLEEVLLGRSSVLSWDIGVARNRLDGAACGPPLMRQGLQHRRLLRESRAVGDVEPGWELREPLEGGRLLLPCLLRLQGRPRCLGGGGGLSWLAGSQLR